MFPSNTSSIDGCSAAVTETESPSQLSPAVNQRMCTSLTPDGANLESEAMPSTPLDQYFFDALSLQIYRHKKYGEFGLIPVEKCHSVAMSGLRVATYGGTCKFFPTPYELRRSTVSHVVNMSGRGRQYTRRILIVSELPS